MDYLPKLNIIIFYITIYICLRNLFMVYVYGICHYFVENYDCDFHLTVRRMEIT
jgi:hypothetical protein